MKKSKRTTLVLDKRWNLPIFLASYVILSLLVFDPKPYTGGDNAVYVTLAESIASGQGFRNLHQPGQTAHTLYPFGFPLLLAPIVLLLGKNILIMKLLIVACGVGAAFFFWRIAHRALGENGAWAGLVFLALPVLVTFNHWVLSEMPFLLFALASIHLLTRYVEERGPWWCLAAGVGLATYSFFIRTAGIALVLGVIVYLAARRRYRELLLFVLVFLAVFLPWQLRNSHVPTEGGYLEQLLARDPYQMERGRASLAELVLRIKDNFILFAFTIVPWVFVSWVTDPTVLRVIGALLLPIFILGSVLRARKWGLLEAYGVFSLGTLLLWPKVWSSERFLLTVLPVMIVAFCQGIVWLGRRFGVRYLMAGVVLVVLSMGAYQYWRLARVAVRDNQDWLRGDRYAGYPADWRRYFETIDWIDRAVPEQAIIMARKPEFVYLNSGRRSMLYPFTENQTVVRDAVMQADYVLVDQFKWTGTTGKYLLPILMRLESKDSLEVLHVTAPPEFFVVRVKKPKDARR